MELYTSLKEISAERFHEIKFEGNILLTYKEYDSNSKQKFSAADIGIAQEAWFKLYDEYYEKSDDAVQRKSLKGHKKKIELLTQINVLKTVEEVFQLMHDNAGYVPEEAILKTMVSSRNSVKKLLPRIKIETTNTLKKNLDIVIDYKISLESRYNILHAVEHGIDEQSLLTYYEVKAQVEQILNKDHIPNYVNMLMWLAYEKQVKQKIKNARQRNQRSGSNSKSNRSIR